MQRFEHKCAVYKPSFCFEERTPQSSENLRSKRLPLKSISLIQCEMSERNRQQEGAGVRLVGNAIGQQNLQICHCSAPINRGCCQNELVMSASMTTETSDLRLLCPNQRRVLLK
jgi:hypothetical protein